MADKITIEIDLDDSGVKDPFKKIETSAKDAQVVINNFQTKIEQNQKRVNGTFDEIVGTLVRVKTLLLSAPPIGKGLFGTISRISFLAGGLQLTADALENVDSRLAQTAATALRFSSIIATGLAGALTFAISKGSQLAFELSTSLVSSLRKISNESAKASANLETLNGFIFNYNALTGNAIGTTSSWSDSVNKLSQELNISSQELNKAASEIIAVASQYGLAEEQLQKLLRVSAEYAKVNGKDVFDVSVRLVGALNGNAQAVQSLGIKLNEAAVSSFALKKGLTENFKSLTDNSKAQVRYLKLIDQFNNISGLAQQRARSLADQQNALTVTTEKLTNAFGKGVSEIENLNIVNSIANRLASILNESFVSFLGTISAVAARVIQFTSAVVSITFKLFLLSKIVAVVNILFDSSISSATLLSKRIPILNKSYGELFSTLTRGKISVDSLSAALTSFRLTLSSLFPFLGGFNKQSGKSFSIISSVGNVIATLLKGFKNLLPVLTVVLAPFLKIGAIIGIIVGAIKLLANAFAEFEKRTGAFNEIYNIVVDSLKSSISIFQPLIDLYNQFASTITRLANQAFGLLITAISKTVSLIASVVASNPFGIFSQQTVSSFAAIEARLDGFNDKLIANNFLLEDSFSNATRNIAGTGDKILIETKKAENGLESLSKQGQVVFNGIVNGIRFTAESIGQSLAGAGQSFDQFLAGLTSILGDLLIQLGTTVLLGGKAITALKASLITLNGGAAIAAGAALIAAGAALKSLADNGVGGGSSSSAPSTSPFPTLENDLSRPTEDLLTQNEPQRQQEQGTAVNINIQGDVLDSEETGTRIARVLSDAFGKQGVILTDARLV